MSKELQECYKLIAEQKRLFEQSLEQIKDERYETIARSEIIAFDYALNVLKMYMKGE